MVTLARNSFLNQLVPCYPFCHRLIYFFMLSWTLFSIWPKRYLAKRFFDLEHKLSSLIRNPSSFIFCYFAYFKDSLLSSVSKWFILNSNLKSIPALPRGEKLTNCHMGRHEIHVSEEATTIKTQSEVNQVLALDEVNVREASCHVKSLSAFERILLIFLLIHFRKTSFKMICFQRREWNGSRLWAVMNGWMDKTNPKDDSIYDQQIWSHVGYF